MYESVLHTSPRIQRLMYFEGWGRLPSGRLESGWQERKSAVLKHKTSRLSSGGLIITFLPCCKVMTLSMWHVCYCRNAAEDGEEEPRATASGRARHNNNNDIILIIVILAIKLRHKMHHN